MKYAQPKVIWITGCYGKDKTSLADELQDICRASSIPAMVLDDRYVGSNLDEIPMQGYYGRMAKSLAEQGYPVIVAHSEISPDIQSWNRKNLPRYFEVHLRNDNGNFMTSTAADMQVRLDHFQGVAALAQDIFDQAFGRGRLLPDAVVSSILPVNTQYPSMRMS